MCITDALNQTIGPLESLRVLFPSLLRKNPRKSQGSIERICRYGFCLMVQLNKIHRKSTMFLKELHIQKHHQLGLRGTESVQYEKWPLDYKNFTRRKQAEKTAQL